jgi:phospholipase/lecithinase/hemolysin
MKKLLGLLLLFTAVTGCGTDKESSQVHSLPFTCLGENATRKYFDDNQKEYLKGLIDNSGVKNLIVLGDSMSDTGNLGRKTFDLVVPKCNYWQNHFSNGPVWSEYVSGGMGIALKTYAVGGAGTSREIDGGLLSWLKYLNPLQIENTFRDLILTSLEDQVTSFKRDLALHKVVASPSNTIIAVWSGPNNYFAHSKDVENKGKIDERAARDLVDGTVNDIRKSVKKIAELGYKRIIVGNMPSLQGLPADPSHLINLASDSTMAFLSDRHNTQIEELVRELRADGLDVIIFRTQEINDKVIKNMNRYGFSGFGPCYTGNVIGFDPVKFKPSFCSEPLRQRSWDHPHPNTRMHCIYASQWVADARQAGWIKSGPDFVDRCVAMRTKTGDE